METAAWRGWNPSKKVWISTKTFLVSVSACKVEGTLKFHRSSKLWAHKLFIHWKFINKPRHHEKISHSRGPLTRILERSSTGDQINGSNGSEGKGSKNAGNWRVNIQFVGWWNAIGWPFYAGVLIFNIFVEWNFRAANFLCTHSTEATFEAKKCLCWLLGVGRCISEHREHKLWQK